jgi:hypothetical protein
VSSVSARLLCCTCSGHFCPLPRRRDVVQGMAHAHDAAVSVEHCIVVSAPPEMFDAYRQHVAASQYRCVMFSPPSVKFIYGVDLLRGHFANIEHAHRHYPRFTHAVLASSNSMWIARLTESWPGFSTSAAGQLQSTCDCLPPDDAKHDTSWWWWSRIKHDAVFWDFVREESVTVVCKGQSEDFFASKQAWLVSSSCSFLKAVAQSQPRGPANHPKLRRRCLPRGGDLPVYCFRCSQPHEANSDAFTGSFPIFLLHR